MTKKAVIIGATGAIGQSLTHQLLASDYISEVVTFTRAVQHISHPKFFNIALDFEHIAAAKEDITGDIFFSCLGTTKKQAGTISAQRKVDVEYQATFAKYAKDNGIPHLLLVSSSGANINSKNAYLQMKGELEQRLKALNFSRLSIFQPSLLVAQRDEIRLAESIGNMVLPLLCKMSYLKKFQPIKVEQVAAQMIEAAKWQQQQNQTYALDALHKPLNFKQSI